MRIAGKDPFTSYVATYLTKTGYAKKFDAKTGVVGIKPPINVG
jgi:hypothetical protein